MIPVTSPENTRNRGKEEDQDLMADGTKKVALVTGAGGGLGREIVLQLARRGCRVAVLDINAAGAEETVMLCAAEQGDAFAIVADLTAKNSAADVVRRAAGDGGRLDILVNNAGYGAIEPFLDMTETLWERTLAINVTALAMLTVAAGRVMRDQRSGRIVNITSPGLAHGAAELHRLRGEQGGRRLDHARRRRRARALRRAGQQRRAGHDGHRDAALDRSRPCPRRGPHRPRRPSSTSARARIPLGRRVEIAEVAEASSGSRSTRPTTSPPSASTVSGGLDKD